MKILIIGAGYVGKALLSFWQNKGHQLFATTTSHDKIETLSKLTEKVFVTSAVNFKEPLNQFDAIVVAVAPKSKLSYEECYLKTTEYLKSQNPPYILYISSTSVYGDHDGDVVTIDSPLKNSHPNGKILIQAEKNISECKNFCIVRLGGIYGPHRTLEDRALRLSGQFLQGNPHTPTNNSELSDIINTIDDLITHKKKGIYNLVDNDHPTKHDLYTKLSRKLKIPPPIFDQKPYSLSLHGSNCIVKRTV